MHNCGVYQITNILTGKFYIGSSVNIAHRWRHHIWHAKGQTNVSRYRLQHALAKHGEEMFEFEVLEECEPIKEVILAREQHYIDTLKPDYNILLIAGSRLGTKHSPETIEKMRGKTPWNKGTGAPKLPKTPEQEEATRRARSLAQMGRIPHNKGIPMTEEMKKLISDAKMGKNLGHEPWNKGIETGPQSAETCALKSQNRKGKQLGPRGPRSAETVKRMSESMTGMERLYARGKASPNSKNGHFGISWRKDTQKWQVRLPSESSPEQDRKFGSYDVLEDALARRDEILARGVDNAVANNENAGRRVLIDPQAVQSRLMSGMTAYAIQRELGITKPTYYRLFAAA